VVDRLWNDMDMLMVRALEDKLKLSADAAKALASDLMAGALPRLWLVYEDLNRNRVGLDLLEELLRYYSVLACGNPTRAAERLAINPSTLRAYIYEHRATYGLA
jgi:hypothetical protein